MRRRTCSSSIRRQRRYTAIMAEHSQREEFRKHQAEIEDAMLVVDSPDPRDPLEIARAASAALKGNAS